jgi:hypothetical protein
VKETSPTLRVVEKPTKENEELRTTLDELLQRGALKMLREALEAEVDEYIRRHRDARAVSGRRDRRDSGNADRQLTSRGNEGEVGARRCAGYIDASRGNSIGSAGDGQ